MTRILFFNTLSRQKEEFKPIEDGVIKMYTCGPTVYDYAHIGNFRAYVFEDILHRFLEYAGYRVIRVMNITDIDDKTIAGAIKEGVSLDQYTERYIKAFFEDMECLKLKKATYFPRATQHIPEMVSLIKQLIEKGHAYEKNGSIYYKISTFPNYGKLSHYDFENLLTSSTDADEYEKDEVRDFALWKATKNEPFFWDTEIGRGRPGWHIECSAMSMKYLGETFDIHTGGVDNIFPHHENEIAQSEAATGKKFVNYWLHCAHLLVNGEKMSKSKGNFYTLRDLLNKGYHPSEIRYLLMTTHYRDPLNFTEQSLKQAEKTIKHVQAFYQRISFALENEEHSRQVHQDIEKYINEASEGFVGALSDDLNISLAMSEVFKFMHGINEICEKNKITGGDAKKIIEFFDRINEVIAIIEPVEKLPEEIVNLIKKREQARKEKNFTLADQIRNTLAESGIVLEDTPYGTRWIRK
ncbi:MAG TPA: cysteine--tRNA ligase [bacterium]|nr:cysteine--tRNA ligase [bacterium]HOL49104.1 cysteine--tRNA ligase [bacterium]HPO52125.1 cysteine--tRNA ligase [bacterium]